MKALIVAFLAFGCAFGAQPSLWANETCPPQEEIHKYIIKGEEAPDGAYPYMLSLKYKKHDSHVCGASVLTKNWALTAGHCCETDDEMYLYSGSNSLSKGGKKHAILYYEIHPEFDLLDEWKYDICLIRVKDPFVYGPKVQQVTLPPQNWLISENDTVRVTGWGYTINEGNWYPDKLQQSNFRALSRKTCESLTRKNHSSYLCVTGIIPGQGACHGDAGSPLVKDGVQVGVASWVYQPCGCGLPDFYARIPFFINWIKQTLGSEASDLKFLY